MSTPQSKPTRRGLLGKATRWALPLIMAGTLAPAFAQDQQELKFRFASVQRPGIYLDGITKFTSLVKDRTGGKVQIEVFCCSQLGGERQIMDGVKLGTIGMGSMGACGTPCSIVSKSLKCTS